MRSVLQISVPLSLPDSRADYSRSGVLLELSFVK